MATTGRTRRNLLTAAIGCLTIVKLRAQPAPEAVIRVLDCGGSLSLSLRGLNAYRRSPGSRVARFVLQTSPAGKMPDRIGKDGRAGDAPFDLVLTSSDALIDGIDAGLWLPLLPEHADRLPDLETILSEPAFRMQRLSRGQGVVTAFSPIGPLFNYIPARVTPVPRTMAELLDWARAHPRRFTYPVPHLTDAGRAFLMCLPYVLNDADPKDPEHGWTKSWSFLQELGATIQNYAVSAGSSFLKLQEGALDICVSSLADDLGSRMSTISDPNSELIDLRDLHWVGSAYYAAIPRNVSPAKLPILLDVLTFLLGNEAQALAYGRGSFYPGPAIRGIGLDQADPASRDLIAPAARDSYADLIAQHPIETPLSPAATRYAFRRWASQIAAAKP